MRKIMSSIINIFKGKSEKGIRFNDIYEDCQSASSELDQYCRLEGLSR